MWKVSVSPQPASTQPSFLDPKPVQLVGLRVVWTALTESGDPPGPPALLLPGVTPERLGPQAPALCRVSRHWRPGVLCALALGPAQAESRGTWERTVHVQLLRTDKTSHSPVPRGKGSPCRKSWMGSVSMLKLPGEPASGMGSASDLV